LFETPARFGLHEEMLDEVGELRKLDADRVLVSLAVANGWTLADGGPETTPPTVIAPGEAAARIAARQLQLCRTLRALRIETIDGPVRAGRTVRLIQGWDVEWFLQDTPIRALTHEAWSESCGPRLGTVPARKGPLAQFMNLVTGRIR
jgi:hypothetical protein